MMQAAAEKLVSVIGHWLPFPFRREQQQQQQRIVFYDEADDNDMWVICPFKNCSGYLLNDGFQTVIDADCPICHRLFCSRCNVPWHAGETCQQFQHNKLKCEILDPCENHFSKKRESPFGDKENLTPVSQSKSLCPIRKSARLCNESPSPPPVQEDLVQSCIVGWQKTTYCPFKNCSVLLVNDGDDVVTSAECPSCHRLFCAQCMVPWHGGINCDEFKQQKKGKEAAAAMETETGSRQSSKSFCGVCFDFVPENDIVRGSGTCNHPFCANCISNHVAAQLSQSVMEFNCPNPRCFEELKPQHLHSILPEEVIVQWESERI
ncbi:putative transcription factor C2H2 family [Medicago truncatula]|uniref:IBR domain protein n=1 Tax=Medicago truncatula TaxID=3880 RepID=G7K2C1_MEDTR|nr:uncharacterized protein LOC11437327 [Medicago truncatula]AES93655.1 IBR domain protein [Medicago truncatula]RHN53293.1 putative transcription factor C2H2 family [Medicago truncatula]